MTVACIAAGHHNTQGGNPVEHRLVGELAEDYGHAFRAAGFTTHVLTPDGQDADTAPGDGEFLGDIAAVGRQAVALSADVLIELHTEAGPRGVFVIYPDWPVADDVDLEVRDQLGPALARSISQASRGIPVRGSGVLSERRTAVGLSGFRLALFAATASARRTMTRCLIEHGAHSQPADLALLEQPVIRANMAAAAAAVCARHFKLPQPVLSTDALLDAEKARCGGESLLGLNQTKARFVWEAGGLAIDADILICERGLVSTSPDLTRTAQILFTNAARTHLVGQLTRY